MKGKKAITAKEFDEKFERGEDMSEHMDWDNATKTLTLNMPLWALKRIDREAARRGIARQALIKTWIIDRVDVLPAESEKKELPPKKAVG